MLPKPQSKGDFLKATNLGPLLNKKGQATAKIVDEPSGGKYGVDVPIEIGGVPFILTLSEKGRDYRAVTDALGLNGDEWEGHSLILGLREGKNKDEEPAEYVTVLRVD
jgi:hypothetical protein